MPGTAADGRPGTPRPPAAVINVPLTTDRLWDRGTPCPFDEVVDVRSPGEFAEDRVPGAVNLPVLSDAERAEVGTVYKQVGAFSARRLGAGYVSANIGRHLRDHFVAKGKDYRPLVHCWRGGQRSASLAVVLAQVGWRVTVLTGGYKTYRTHVRAELDAAPGLFTVRVVGGRTGSAKTHLLHALAARGAQVLDLEGLARHRGSVLGRAGPQPAQKLFESLVLDALGRLDPAAPVWVEAESHRIGDLLVPPALWAKMRAADGVVVRMSVAARVEHLTADYPHFLADPAGLKANLRQLTARRGPHQVAAWNAQIDAGDWPGLVASLLETHYDPAYDESARRNYPHVTRPVELTAATPDALAGLAAELASGCDPMMPTPTD